MTEDIYFYRCKSEFHFFNHKLTMQEQLLNGYDYIGVLSVDELGDVLEKILALRDSLDKFKLKR
ncbi:hypothetical protein HCJ13_13930 [Listeria booriae]|uniref:hypothetical protein n=1 Tax=Listeria booriae TaxID=1552123 RepID=UPI001628F5C3|nr:hypothetical protein [Listeria booriae]MBC1651291.1 hypothetical protein [Listeria booriae]